MRIHWNLSLIFLIALSVLSLGSKTALADPPTAPKVSTFAPIDDLVAQINYFKEQTEKGVANQGEFDDGAQSKLKKDANTTAVLALALALHDGDNGLKTSAGAIVAAAQKVAESTKELDHAKSKAAVEELSKAVAGANKSDKKLTWNEKVGDLPPLMKAVPLINNRLKKGVAKMDPTSAGNAATLAIIAQATMADLSAVKKPEDAAKWYEFSAIMRDAAGDVNQGLHANDKDKVTSAMKRLGQSCEDCHAVFRKNEAAK